MQVSGRLRLPLSAFHLPPAMLRRALLKTLAFHASWRHAPTGTELLATLEWNSVSHPSHGEVAREIETLLSEGRIFYRFGRYAIDSGAAANIETQRANEFWHARKLRAAGRVCRWLVRLSGVRFVALCNTTALGHAQDEGDLDFFVVTKAGKIMTTRGLAALPWRVLGHRPGDKSAARDPVCLSYFIADDGLDLSGQMLKPDDPYYRYWFLSLVPLFDDGVGEDLWRANTAITSRHPFAERWRVSPDLDIAKRLWRIPAIAFIEK